MFVATKWLGLTNSYRLHGMKFVLFSEQHWSNYLGGCSIVYTRNCNLLAIPLLWFLSGPWPRENGIAMLSCPFHQVRMVGNTLKCSINALSFFWSCHIAVQVSPMIITYPGYLPHLLTNFFFMASLLAKVEWGGEPLDHLESHQGTGQQGVLVLKKTGAGIWGEGPNQDRWWFIMWSHIYLPWVSSNARQASRIQSHLKTIPL